MKANTLTQKSMTEKIKELESLLTGDMNQDMEIRDEIHKLKMIENGVEPENDKIECIGCGS